MTPSTIIRTTVDSTTATGLAERAYSSISVWSVCNTVILLLETILERADTAERTRSDPLEQL
jgi:hypothetical protein